MRLEPGRNSGPTIKGICFPALSMGSEIRANVREQPSSLVSRKRPFLNCYDITGSTTNEFHVGPSFQ
jgi:hypothetical protein